jgi:glycosyltransferase involved in cell wall biosynthesis
MIVDKKRLRTLHVDLGRQWRGGQSQALLLAGELQRMGHAAEMVALRDSPLAQRAKAAGIVVHEARGRIGAARMLWRLRGFDIVHAHEAHALTAAWLARATFVVSRRLAYPISKLRYRSAKRIVAISRFVKQSVLDCGFADERVEVVYDGVPVPEAPATGGEGTRIGCVGYLLPEKNQKLLIRSLPLVLARHPGCRLILAGEGPARAGLERLAGQLGVAGSADFAGHVEDVASVYRSLDVFLFPSIAEPLGSSLLAAMSYGLPCVALARGAVPEVIENGVNGLMVGDSDPKAFAEAMNRLLDDQILRACLGAAARKAIEERFSVEHMARGTVEVYERVLADCKSAAG